MAIIAIACNVLIGHGARETRTVLLLIVPLAVSISCFLISDIDSPNGGLIHVPQKLVNLAATMHPH